MSEESKEAIVDAGEDAELKRKQDELDPQELEMTEEERKQKRQRLEAQKDIDDALRLLKSGAKPLDEIVMDFPYSLRPDFLRAFLKAKDEFPLLLIGRFSMPALDDKGLMLGLCSYEASVYRAIPDKHTLKADEEIVKAFLEAHPLGAEFPPLRVILEHAHLVGAVLARLPLWYEGIRALALEKLDPGVWNNRDVVLGWAQGGGDLHDRIPESLRQDKEVLFATARIKKAGNPIPQTLPNQIKSNKDDMIDLVQQNPLYLCQVGAGLVGDLDLIVAALSGEDGVLARFLDLGTGWFPEGNNGQLRFFYEVANHVRSKLLLRDAFVKLVLGSVSSSTDNKSALSVLRQGEETVKAFNQSLAEYSGVPFGKELGRLLRARETLALGGLRWSDPKV